MEMDLEDSESLIELVQVPSSAKGLGPADKPMAKKWRDRDIAEGIAELRRQLQLAAPLVVVSFLQYSLQMISVMFVGRLGELPLASASMATSFAGVTGFSFMLGMGSALETLCGQAYGAKQYHMLGMHLQRSMFVLMLACIPIAILWTSAGYVFTCLGQDLGISALAGLYARWLIPTIFPYGLLQCLLRFLQTQNNLKPLVISTGITSIVHVITCWTLVFRVGFGSKGAALSNTISYWINVLILAVYIKFSPACKKTWTGFSKEGVENLGSFLSLAIPSALMVCLEFWSYEFLVLMSGLLPNPRLETSMMSIRYCKRMWLAEDWRICKSRGLLPCGSSFSNHPNFCLPFWGKGPLDGNHRWEWPASTATLGYHHAHRLGASRKRRQVLAAKGKENTTDVAGCLVKIEIKSGVLVAVACAAIVGITAVACLREADQMNFMVAA